MQMKTFVKKVTVGGHEKYEPENKKFYFDDLIDGTFYSYIATKCFPFNVII